MCVKEVDDEEVKDGLIKSSDTSTSKKTQK